MARQHWICLAALLSVSTFWGGGVEAADYLVSQKGRQFSPAELTVRVGDTVTFANDDDIPHNVASTTGANAFDLGHQLPGTATPVSFTEPGDVKIECLMHPRMQMTITVGPR